MPWRRGPRTVELTSFGVPLRVIATSGAAARALDRALPPVAIHTPVSDPLREVRFSEDARERFSVHDGEQTAIEGAALEVALDVLDATLRSVIANHAPGHLFIHAGAVAYQGVGIAIPGDGFAGKSTLVAALVSRGAAYLSDDLAPIDVDGMLHPYPRLMSLRAGGLRSEPARVSAHEVGGREGDQPVPIGLVVRTQYVPGAEWQPSSGPVGRAALALLSHAVASRENPARALSVLKRATTGVRVLEGERGEAEPCAEAILATGLAGVVARETSVRGI